MGLVIPSRTVTGVEIVRRGALSSSREAAGPHVLASGRLLSAVSPSQVQVGATHLAGLDAGGVGRGHVILAGHCRCCCRLLIAVTVMRVV